MPNVSTLFITLFFLTCQVVSAQDSLHLYLIRGIGRESGHWGPEFLNRIQSQKPNCQIHFLDLPGSGIYFEQPALMSIPKMAEFLEQKYGGLTHQKSGMHVLLATSLAGNVALEWSYRYPHNFSGLILVGTSLKKVCKKKDRVQPEAKKGFVNIFLSNDLEERESKFLAINSNEHQNNDSLLQAWIGIQHIHPVKRSALMKQTVAGMLYKPKEETPQIPVLVIGSEGDKIVKPACICAVRKHLHASLTMHPSSGHGVPIDAPIWLADQVSDWVSYEVALAPHQNHSVVANVGNQSFLNVKAKRIDWPTITSPIASFSSPLPWIKSQLNEIGNILP
ncbi:MAG: alpha/beta hydrolase [Bacteroidota bacterium]